MLLHARIGSAQIDGLIMRPSRRNFEMDKPNYTKKARNKSTINLYQKISV